MPRYDGLLYGGRVDGLYDIGILHGQIEVMEALTALEMASKPSWNPARMFGFTSKGHLSPGADVDITAINPETGTPDFGMVAGQPIMRNGHALGQGGTLLVTHWGETTARKSGLDYRLVDLSKTKLYADWT